MADITKYGFLIDRDVAKATALFPRKRTRTTLQVGLAENASDAKIVELACDRQWIIVTGNGDHFIEEILKYQKKIERKICHDLSGLVILPNGYEIQKRVVPGAEAKLRFGGKKITWSDVWYRNYCVRILKDGSAAVTTFPKCLYCRKLQEKAR